MFLEILDKTLLPVVVAIVGWLIAIRINKPRKSYISVHHVDAD